MKKSNLILLLISLFIILPNLYSQNVSINAAGTLPDASAMLDISSTSSGFLIPRMTTAQQNAFASPATSLLIFNTTTGYFMVNTGTPGSPAWTPLAYSGWSLSGNSGTVDGTNFLGTTDNVPLNFRVNNQRAGRIDNTNANTFFGYQAGNSNTTGIQNTFIGQRAGYNNLGGLWNTFVGDSAGYSTTSGYRNTSIGYQSLFNNTTGWFNNAFGHRTLYNNTTGSENMAVGQAALYGNISGTHNIAVGNFTLESTTAGGNNTAVGYSALYFNNDATGDNTAVGYSAMYNSTSGHSNTAVGTGALNTTTGNFNTAIGNNTGGTNTTGSNNTFIGANAGPSGAGLSNATAIGYGAIVAASNSLVLGNGANVGIGTSTPGSSLDVQGTLRLSGSTSGYIGFTPAAVAGSTTYTLPIADGTNGQQLTTNGGSVLSWTAGFPAKNYYQAIITNPGSTNSSTVTMTGLGGSITINTGTKALIVISGDASTSGNNGSAKFQIYYGTGAAPSTGNAVTGTAAGSNINLQFIGTGSNQRYPFTCSVIVTGLTPGQTYWIDLGTTNSGGNTIASADINLSAVEL